MISTTEKEKPKEAIQTDARVKQVEWKKELDDSEDTLYLKGIDRLESSLVEIKTPSRAKQSIIESDTPKRKIDEIPETHSPKEMI